MLRFVFRLAVIGVVLGGAAYALGYRWDGASDLVADAGSSAAGALSGRVDSEKIRQTGSEIAGAIAGGADRAEGVLSEASLTAKIKSKMALDDTLDGSHLDVDTEGTVVTVRGDANSAAQRERALQLARETKGVTSVVNRIELNGR
jgi:osmotically-inducible protein OsmY